jgi:hypothetical protein
MSLTYKVPIRPHLKKFVLYKENLSLDEALVVDDKRGYIPFFINLILCNKKTYHKYSNTKLPANYSDRLLIEFPVSHQLRNHIFLTNVNIKKLNNFIHKCFHDSLNQHIEQNCFSGSNIKESIYEYMSLLEIYDDISFETLKKGNYRFRKEKDLPPL